MNKYIRPIDSTLLRNKLEKLSALLKGSLANQDFTTLESVLTEANQVLSSFYSTLGKSSFVPQQVLPGTPPSPDDFNKNILKILDDLEVLFFELENVESVVLQNFNYFISQSDRLNSKIKSINSLLGNYTLYANNILKDSTYFSDTFSNLDNIETDTSFYSNTRAEISQSEGIVTLPIITSPESVIKISVSPIINSNSNGVPGNNQEIGARLNGNIDLILDNNPDTWFEYEKVVNGINDDGTPLVLDLRLDLGLDKVVNFFRINPNNFGTKSQVYIDDISTSLDGLSFISIKDEITIPGFTTEDEANVFNLSPSTSKFTGQGIYTFTPRLARYIHLTLTQKTPYTIETLSGQKLRYAIGIRDIEIQSQKYQSKGEIVSSEHVTSNEIDQLILLTSQNPSTESSLVSITHQVSPDNGDSWIEIRPKEFAGNDGIVNTVAEVVSFNSGQDNSTITASPVRKLRYRAVLERKGDAFQTGSSDLHQKKGFATELHQTNTSSPFSVTLQHPPIANSITVTDPHYGSRGLTNYKYVVATATGTRQEYSLPWKNIPGDLVKALNSASNYYIAEVSPVRVYVHGSQWTVANLATSSSTATVFNLDPTRGILKFGNGTLGKSPDLGAPITVDLTPERLFTVPSDLGHIAQLRFPTSGDKKVIQVKRADLITSFNEPLTKVGRTFKLANQNIQSGTVIFQPTSGAFSSEKTFIDGGVELTGAGHYSMDYESGILYSYTPTDDTSEVTIYYKYQPIVTITPDGWDFSETSALKDTIIIKDKSWATTSLTGETVPYPLKKFSLSNFNIESGTLQFSNNTVFAKEVKFNDGRTEILGLIRAQEIVPAGVLTGAGVRTFNLSLVPADITNHVIAFSNTTVFATQVVGTPAVSGEYQIVGRVVNVKIAATVTNPGYATYFYQDPTKVLTGVYSVDYKLGDVYSFSPTVAGITADYQYSNLTASYPIARLVPSEDIEIDLGAAKITISDREILRRVQIPSATTANGTGNTYQVLYNYVQSSRANLSELEPYFTPILKEYILKVLPKNKIF